MGMQKPMECPGSHEWYELARDRVAREDGDRLRRHLGTCEGCRDEADAAGSLAASLERLAEATRTDLPESAAADVLRLARERGLIGRPVPAPATTPLRGARRHLRWIRWALPVTAAAAVVVLVALNHWMPSSPVVPAGAFVRLVDGSTRADSVAALTALAPVARAAVAEELAQREPEVDQVSDLVLVAYITRQARESRQAADVRFLLEGAAARRNARATAHRDDRVARAGAWPMLAVVGASPARLLGAAESTAADPTAAGRALILPGRYAEALAALPTDGSARILRAWCYESLGRRAEASLELDPVGAADTAGPMARVLRADLAIQDRNVAEAMRQYEALAAGRADRFWFGAGYLCRYELGDLQGAGQRFAHVKEPRLGGYVTRAFQAELAAARRGPKPLKFDDFESYGFGTPEGWTLVRMRPDEFRVVETYGGKAVEINELGTAGSEVLTGRTDWSDYTFQMDVQVAQSRGDYVIGAVVYRRADQTGYVLELTPYRLRLLKQCATRGTRSEEDVPADRLVVEPSMARMALDTPPAKGWWYTMKIRVQRVDGTGVAVAGKMWRTDTPEPMAWQVTWTDRGQSGSGVLDSGFAGFQIRGARVLVDNVKVTKNDDR